MKKIKTRLLLAIASFFFLLALAPATKAQAATAPVPANYKAWNQSRSTIQVAWSLDSSLKNKVKGKDFGYEIYFIDMNGKTIQKATESSVKIAGNVCIATATNTRFQSEPVKVNIRTYIVSNGKKVWSAFAKKYFVPRATIYNASSIYGSTKVRIYWHSVKGAGGYHLYISGDGGKTFKKIAATTGTAATTCNLKLDKQYIIYVKAVNVKCGTKKYSSNNLTYTSTRGANTAGLTLRRIN